MMVSALPPLLLLAGMFATAVALRRRLRLRPSSTPPPTASEAAWLRELAALDLERRHLYC